MVDAALENRDNFFTRHMDPEHALRLGRERLVEILGIAKESPEKQDQIIETVGTRALERTLSELYHKLSPDNQRTADALLDADDLDGVRKLFTAHIPNVEAISSRVVRDVVAEHQKNIDH